MDSTFDLPLTPEGREGSPRLPQRNGFPGLPKASQGQHLAPLGHRGCLAALIAPSPLALAMPSRWRSSIISGNGAEQVEHEPSCWCRCVEADAKDAEVDLLALQAPHQFREVRNGPRELSRQTA